MHITIIDSCSILYIPGVGRTVENCSAYSDVNSVRITSVVATSSVLDSVI